MSAPAVAAADPAWLKTARQLVGLKEIVGSRHEPKVLQFFAEAGHPEIHNDETAWCAAFANAMLRRAGCAGTGSLAARSFLTWGAKLAAPRLGCIVVYKRGNSAWQGHVNFFTRKVGRKIYGIGGNQSNGVNETAIDEADVLGYRWPAVAAAPVAAPTTKTKEAAKAAAVAVTTVAAGRGAKAAVDAGWGWVEWSVTGAVLVALVVAAWFGWRWWRARKAAEAATDAPAAPVAEMVAAAKTRPVRPRAARAAAAKTSTKRKPAKSTKRKVD